MHEGNLIQVNKEQAINDIAHMLNECFTITPKKMYYDGDIKYDIEHPTVLSIVPTIKQSLSEDYIKFALENGCPSLLHLVLAQIFNIGMSGANIALDNDDSSNYLYYLVHRDLPKPEKREHLSMGDVTDSFYKIFKEIFEVKQHKRHYTYTGVDITHSCILVCADNIQGNVSRAGMMYNRDQGRPLLKVILGGTFQLGYSAVMVNDSLYGKDHFFKNGDFEKIDEMMGKLNDITEKSGK